jgi:hypothetical protein
MGQFFLYNKLRSLRNALARGCKSTLLHAALDESFLSDLLMSIKYFLYQRCPGWARALRHQKILLIIVQCGMAIANFASAATYRAL